MLVQDIGTGDKAKRDLAAFGLVETSQITRIEFDLPIAERNVIAGNDAIDRPGFGA